MREQVFRIHCLFSVMEENASEYEFEGQLNPDSVAFKFQNRSLVKNGMAFQNGSFLQRGTLLHNLR